MMSDCYVKFKLAHVLVVAFGFGSSSVLCIATGRHETDPLGGVPIGKVSQRRREGTHLMNMEPPKGASKGDCFTQM